MSTPNVERKYLQPFEVKTLAADFSDVYEIATAGETLVASPVPTVALTQLKGTGTLNVGAIALSGSRTSALFSGSPAVGDLYKLVWLATTSAGHTLQITGELSIVETT